MYNIDDCVLIRKTTVFPKDGIVETPKHGIAYNFGRSTVLGDALYDILSEKYPDYERVIPKNYTNQLYVNRLDLISALKRLTN